MKLLAWGIIVGTGLKMGEYLAIFVMAMVRGIVTGFYKGLKEGKRGA